MYNIQHTLYNKVRFIRIDHVTNQFSPHSFSFSLKTIFRVFNISPTRRSNFTQEFPRSIHFNEKYTTIHPFPLVISFVRERMNFVHRRTTFVSRGKKFETAWMETKRPSQKRITS